MPVPFRLLAFSVATATLLTGFAASAQTATPVSPPSTTAPGATSAANIPDKKLDAVAAAAKKVVVLNRTYKQKLDQAPDSQKEQLAKEANSAMSKAVTDQGLSVDEYMSIMQVAQNDPAVREKLIQRMK